MLFKILIHLRRGTQTLLASDFNLGVVIRNKVNHVVGSLMPLRERHSFMSRDLHCEVKRISIIQCDANGNYLI